MNVGANACAAFAETSVSFTVKDANYKRGDFDGNNIVDYDDVIAFLAKMGATDADEDWAENKMYDLDNDGDVDYDDLIELLSLMEFDGRRGGASTRGDKVIRLWLEADKATVAPGDIITVKLMAENMTGQGMSAFKCNVNFNAADLVYNGEFDADEVVNSAFNSIRDGSLAENGIAELIGTFAKRNVMSELAIDGEPFELATLSLVVKATAAGNINIDLSNLNASTQAATRAGVSVLDGTLEVVTESLTIPVDGGAAVVPEFAIEFAAHQQTRAANVALKVGMAENASVAFNADEGDMTSIPGFSEVYDVSVIDGRRDEKLHTDIRGLANRETWSVKVTVGKGQALTLDWSDAELPEYFDFSIVKGKYYNATEVIDMREVTSLAFSEGETFITIVADKKASSETSEASYTFSLTAGWNLIGIPLEMDAESLAKFANVAAVFTYDEATQSYIQIDDTTALAAGCAYWVFATEAAEITVNGSIINAEGVALKVGWNWVTPLNDSELAMPADAVKAIWFYTSDGYRQATEDADIQLGRGYWVYSEEDAVIWQTK
jgi:Ca2+-binding EF-hand superfamily protein